jgi:cytochrome c oxidase assembly protein subunit 15
MPPHSPVSTDPLRLSRQRRTVSWWLIVVALMIAAMVIIGGLTRLTGSGLSITEWDPIMGAIPPLSAADWMDAFHKYQHIPQYIREHQGMTLDQFKGIYWWEWTHRLLGRLIGFVFLIPFLFFVWTGAISRAGIPRMVALFALGGLQGFVGWWMVESGLETRVSVSQYRLAIHLGVALILFAAILWTALEYLRIPSPPLGERARVRGTPENRNQKSEIRSAKEGIGVPISEFRFRASEHPLTLALSPSGGEGEVKRSHTGFVFAFVILVYLQMLLGALVAGLHAGLIYNTWPSMDGRALPEDPFLHHPWWINFFENPGLAQFDHRIGAYVVAISAIALWWSAIRAKLTGAARASAYAVLVVTGAQFTLGVLTLLHQAPLLLSALHQATAVALLSAAIWYAFEIRAVASQQRLSWPDLIGPPSRGTSVPQ